MAEPRRQSIRRLDRRAVEFVARAHRPRREATETDGGLNGRSGSIRAGFAVETGRVADIGRDEATRRPSLPPNARRTSLPNGRRI